MHDGTNEWTDFNVISSVMTLFDIKSLVMILVIFPMTQAGMTQMAIQSGARSAFGLIDTQVYQLFQNKLIS